MYITHVYSLVLILVTIYTYRVLSKNPEAIDRKQAGGGPWIVSYTSVLTWITIDCSLPFYEALQASNPPPPPAAALFHLFLSKPEPKSRNIGAIAAPRYRNSAKSSGEGR